MRHPQPDFIALPFNHSSINICPCTWELESCLLVLPDIEDFGSNEGKGIVGGDAEENFIASAVEWFVVIPIDLFAAHDEKKILKLEGFHLNFELT